jgi:hypothetical protein
LYEKLAPTLLMFNADFRSAEERDRRARAAEEAGAVQLPMMGPEPSFIESVTATSLTLSSALEQMDRGAAAEVVTAKHQAMVLDKLVASETPAEDEIPSP